MPGLKISQSLVFYGSALVTILLAIFLLVSLTSNTFIEIVLRFVSWGFDAFISLGAFQSCVGTRSPQFGEKRECEWLEQSNSSISETAHKYPAFDVFRSFLVIGCGLAFINGLLNIIRSIKQFRIPRSILPNKHFYRAIIVIHVLTAISLIISLKYFRDFAESAFRFHTTEAFGQSYDFLCVSLALAAFMIIVENLAYIKFVMRDGTAINSNGGNVNNSNVSVNGDVPLMEAYQTEEGQVQPHLSTLSA